MFESQNYNEESLDAGKNEKLLMTNKAQIELVRLFFPDLSTEDGFERWTTEGWSEEFRELFEYDKTLEKRLMDGDENVIDDIYTRLVRNYL